MEVMPLRDAYARLVEVAEDDGFAAPAPGEWRAELILAHVIASTRMIAAAAAELLAGRTPVLDNRPTQSVAYLEAIAGAAESWEELVREVERTGRELLTLAARLEEAELTVQVPAIFVDGGVIRVQRPIPFRTLVAPTHIEGHTEQLRSLADQS